MTRTPCTPSQRLAALSGYAFAELDALRDARLAAGADVIDFGVGDPTEPTPDSVVAAAQAGLVRHRRSGYPAYHGSARFREAVAAWWARRYGLQVDPATEVTSSVGSKEAIFHLPAAFVDPGDVVLVPSPGYPPYARGTHMVGGRVATYAVSSEGSTLPDLDALPPADQAALRVVWITQPHVPTGRAATRAQLERLAAQCAARGVLLCSDEAYSELWMDAPVPSLLEVARRGVLVFQSLSKRAAMTGYRVGFVTGDAAAVASFRRLKVNIDSGTPDFVQDAAVAALADDDISGAARQAYAQRIDVLCPVLAEIGCRVQRPQAGFYLWVAVPAGESGVAFARRLLGESPALAAMPGEWLCDPVPEVAHQPGDGMLRLALVPSLERCHEAAERLRAW